MDEIIGRLTSPLFWSFVLGIIVTLSVVKISGVLLEVKNHLITVQQYQYDHSKQLSVLIESNQEMAADLDSIRDVVKRYENYVLPSAEEMDAIDRLRNENI